jgi:hypothetical protein
LKTQGNAFNFEAPTQGKYFAPLGRTQRKARGTRLTLRHLPRGNFPRPRGYFFSISHKYYNIRTLNRLLHYRMVKISGRKALLKDIQEGVEFLLNKHRMTILAGEIPSDDQEDALFQLLAYQAHGLIYFVNKKVLSSRFSVPRGNLFPEPKPDPNWHYLIYQCSDATFKSDFRLSREFFSDLFEMIKDHRVFQSHARNKQAPVCFQMLVALWRLGCYGNSAKYKAAEQKFSIGLFNLITLPSYRISPLVYQKGNRGCQLSDG